jgi:hypothetical protein
VTLGPTTPRGQTNDTRSPGLSEQTRADDPGEVNEYDLAIAGRDAAFLVIEPAHGPDPTHVLEIGSPDVEILYRRGA